MPRFLLPISIVLATALSAADDPVVFKSDVAVTRVDAQVMDHDGRAVTGLDREDFVLRVDGKVVPIRNFASENMPIDILLLLDVSGSMQPHVERIANAAQQALNVLAPKDRVAIMIFDTYTRVKLPFSSSHADVTNALNRLLRSERFNGGTRITRAMLEAANYVDREARSDARRAIVILTDDQTQDAEDEYHVESALRRANAVLSFLQAEYEVPGMNGGGGRPHGTWGSNGGGWPGGGGIGFPGSGGGIGFPGRGGGMGRGGVDMSHSAGTAEIARDSGGDTMQVDDASSLEDTLMRLRQRYALYFYLPEGSTSADKRTVQVDLADRTRMQYQLAEVRYRRVYMAGPASQQSSGPVVSRVQRSVSTSTGDATAIEDTSAPKGRRVAVNEDSGPQVNSIDIDADTPDQQSSRAAAPATASPTNSSPHTAKSTAPPE